MSIRQRLLLLVVRGAVLLTALGFIGVSEAGASSAYSTRSEVLAAHHNENGVGANSTAPPILCVYTSTTQVPPIGEVNNLTVTNRTESTLKYKYRYTRPGSLFVVESGTQWVPPSKIKRGHYVFGVSSDSWSILRRGKRSADHPVAGSVKVGYLNSAGKVVRWLDCSDASPRSK